MTAPASAVAASGRHAPIRLAYYTGMNIGGAERQILELARRLPPDRFAVEFIVFGRPGPIADEVAALGFPVHILGAARPPGTSRPVGLFRAASITWRLIRTIRRRRYDIVDGWLFYGYTMLALSRPLTRVPVIVAGRRSLSLYKRRHGPVARAADGMARRWSDAIVANSEAVAVDVAAREGIPIDRLTIIRNGVLEAAPMPPDERRRIRGGWGVADEATVVIGCVGAFREVKGHRALLRAMAEVRRSTEVPVRLVLVGDGPLRPTLEHDVVDLDLASVVQFAGRLADARLVYGAFDMVAQASDEEGLPNAMLEAAAAGRALVATDAGGTSEIVIDGRTGLLVPTGDEAALAAALRRAIEDPELRGRLGGAARDHVREAFGMDAMVAAFAELYERLIARER